MAKIKKTIHENKLMLSLFTFLTTASGTAGTLLKIAHDKEVKHQQEYEVFNNNKLDEQECKNIITDSLVHNHKKDCQ